MQPAEHYFSIGDLVTFIEGETWVFIDKDGDELPQPPIGIVIGLERTYNGVKVYWFGNETLTTEWDSQIQRLEDFMETRNEKSVYWG